MKKRVLMVLAVLLMAAFGGAYADDESTGVPFAIADVMTFHTNNGYRIQSFSILSSGEWAAATLQNAEGHNFLYLFKYQNDGWSLYLRTDNVVFQGTHFVDAHFEEGKATFDTGRNDLSFSVETPLLVIGQMNSDQEGVAEYFERSISFTLQEGHWLLVSLDDFSYCSVYVCDKAMYYSGSWISEFQPWYGKVDVTFQRDIRWLNIMDIPRTYSEANQMFTVWPNNPVE